jgi:serine/threonine protein kinase
VLPLCSYRRFDGVFFLTEYAGGLFVQVVHCDLKAANILTTKNGNIKLSDFGVSLNLNAMHNRNDVTGTPNWSEFDLP